MNKWQRFSVLFIALLLITASTATGYAAPATQPITGVTILPPTVQLFGHVTLIDGYALSLLSGYVAVVELRDTPGKNVAILTSDLKFQNLLVAAMTTGNLVSFVGQKNTFLTPLPPRGGSWNMDIYVVDEIILYNFQ